MNDRYTMPAAFQADPPRLLGSRDATTGETYFPPRSLSVDGQLRPLTDVELSDSGVLHAFTKMGATTYGQVDLPEKVRILSTLAPGDYEIGMTCRLEVVPGQEGAPAGWRFARA